MKPIVARLIPYIFLGVIIVLFIVGMLVLSYLLIIGALVGLVLFIISWVKSKLLNKNALTPKNEKRSGRTIDHHDF